MHLKPTILVVDDDPVAVSLLTKLVEKLEYNVLSAGDGRMALEMLDQNSIDLVIADYDMPRMNGLELLAVVKEKFPRLPFILITAYSKLTVVREAWNLGAFDFFQKPVFVDRLHQTIRLAIEYGHLSIARRAFASTESYSPDPDILNTGVIRELAAALEREDLLRIVEEFETYARIELEHMFRYSMIKDAEQVRVYAHRLKGTATNLGMIKIASHMAQIEAAPDAAITNMGELAIELESSIHWLKQNLTQIFQDLRV